MKHAIDYRNMHTGIHGLVLFNNEKTAEELYTSCKIAEQNHPDSEPIDYDQLLIDLFENESCGVIEEVNFRTLTKILKEHPYSINVNGRVQTVTEDINIINFNQSVDLYC